MTAEPLAGTRGRAPGAVPDAVILDCDGVLVDSERITSRVFAELLTELGIRHTQAEVLERFTGHSMAECQAIAESLNGGRPLAVHLGDALLERARAAYARELVPVPGIVEVLDLLDATGIPYCVASNGDPEKMDATLGVTGLAARFAGRRFSARDVGRAKPAPDLFLHAARALGAVPARCVVVEDSPLGVQGGAAAGMTVLGYAELIAAERLVAAGAAATFTDMRELPALLGLVAGAVR